MSCKDLDKKRCIWCHLDIPVGARVCTNCDKNQNRAYEFSKSIITLSGIVGLVFSAAAYVGDDVSRIFGTFFSPKIVVESFESDRSARIKNESLRSVFVASYEMSLELPGRPFVVYDLVEVEIAPSRAIRIDTRSARTRRAEEVADIDGGFFVPSLEKDKFAKVLDFEGGSLKFFSVNDPELGTVLRHARMEVEELTKASCRIRFDVEFSSVSRTHEFECVAVAAFEGKRGQTFPQFLKQLNATQ